MMKLSGVYYQTRQHVLTMTAMLTSTCFLPGCSEQLDTASEFSEKAHVHERNGELDQAVDAYTRALELTPDSPVIFYDRGVAYGARGEYQKAIADYTQAIKLDPGFARAFNNRAAVYAQLGEFEKAVSDCTSSIDLNPENFLAYRNRGLAKHDLGNQEAAIADYDLSIRLNGRSAMTWLYRGNVYLDIGKYKRAVENFDRAIELDESMARAWLHRAVARARLGNEEAAQKDLAEARRLGADTSAFQTADPATQSDQPGSPELPELVAGSEQTMKQAVATAREFLSDRGYTTTATESADDAPWQIRAERGDEMLRAIVCMNRDQDDRMRFSRAEVEAVIASPSPVWLSVVGPHSESTTGLQVTRHFPDWSRQASQLVPVEYEFRASTGESTASRPVQD